MLGRQESGLILYLAIFSHLLRFAAVVVGGYLAYLAIKALNIYIKKESKNLEGKDG